jgi:putative ABC transport system ATP-binding protein
VHVVLQATGLQLQDRGTPRFANIDLTLRGGDAAVLLGPAGAGKTTLLALLGGLLAPDAGELRLAGQRVPFENHAACLALRRQHIGFIAQRVPTPAHVTIEENLIAAGEARGLGRAAAGARARELLFRVGLVAHLDKFPTELNRSQLQSVAVAHALFHRPSLLLADDPTAGVDRAQADMIANLLLIQARVAGAALLVVTHDSHLLPRFDRILTLDAGRLHEHSAFARPLRAREPSSPPERRNVVATATAS